MTNNKGQKKQDTLALFFIAVLAAVPRLTSLNSYLIVDEPGRWEWAKTFFTALVSGNPAKTMIHGYPGVLPDWFSTVWIGVNTLRLSWLGGEWLDQGGLYVMLKKWGRIPEHLADQRLGVALGNTAMVILAYLLIRRIFGRKIALVSGVLIALDPFYLSDSRINRAEAVTTGVTFIALLLFILYIQENKRRWLILSGATAGLACLSKIQAVLILPILGLLGLIYWITYPSAAHSLRQPIKTWAIAMLIWTLAMLAAFWAAWPAMWVAPRETLLMVWDYVTEQSGATGVNLFFLGHVVQNQDPGPLFYPLAFLLRVNPLVLIGIAAGGWTWLRSTAGARKDWLRASPRWWMLALFVLIYPALMTLGSHKQDRYLMIIFPMVNLLAAPGLIWAWRKISAKWRGSRSTKVGFAGLVLAQLLLIWPVHPYYFPYFNPLIRGPVIAPRLIRIGWGEGLDQVADYLQSLPEPQNLRIASRFPRHLLGFKGEIVALDARGEWTRSNYIIFYIHQTQRMQDPGPGEVRWLQTYRPEHVVRLNGIDYAWVYRNPVTIPANPQISRIDDELEFFGYIWDATENALRLVWLNKQPKPERKMLIRLRNRETTTDWLLCNPAPGFTEAAQTPLAVVESACNLDNLPELPVGLYDLQAGVKQKNKAITPLVFPEGQFSLSVQNSGRLTQLPLSQALDEMAAAALPAEATPLNITYGEKIRLVGYRRPADPLHPGKTVTFTLYWQALQPLAEDYTVFAHLFTANETRVAGTDIRHSTGKWLTGVVQTAQYPILLPAELDAPVILRLDVGLYNDALKMLHPADAAGNELTWEITRLKIVPKQLPELSGVTPVEASFTDGAGVINLSGYKLEPENPKPGNTLTLTLYWQPQTTPEQDYTVFTQLLNAQHQVVAQHDGPPRGGRYPTSWWSSGEIIADTHPILLPPDLPPGKYTLLAGLYCPDSGERLFAADATGNALPDNAAVIVKFNLTK